MSFLSLLMRPALNDDGARPIINRAVFLPAEIQSG